MDEDKNPSPPPELKEELYEDRIGGTVFSKHWLFQVLMNAIQAVEKETEEGAADSTNIVELSKEVEDDLCLLWDMSVDGDVAHFLHEFKAVEIFLEVIEKTRSPRLMEISIGILGNMLAFCDICVDATRNQSFVYTILHLLGSSDTPTLIQVVRALRCGVVNKETSDCWLQHIQESPATNYVQFILQNSLNDELLKATLQLVYNCLDASGALCLTVIQEEFIGALTTATRLMLKKGDHRGLDEYAHILHMLLCHQESTELIAKFSSDICSVLIPYLLKCDNDMVLEWDRTGALAAAVSTFVCLSTNQKVEQAQEIGLWLENMLGLVNMAQNNLTEFSTQEVNISERVIHLQILSQDLKKLQDIIATSLNSVVK